MTDDYYKLEVENVSTWLKDAVFNEDEEITVMVSNFTPTVHNTIIVMIINRLTPNMKAIGYRETLTMQIML